MGTTTIIVLTIILIIVLATAFAIFYIQNKIKDVSEGVFGTRDLKEAAEIIHQEDITRHKSVAALTSLMLPKIKLSVFFIW